MKKQKVSIPILLGVILILCSLGMMVFFKVRMELGVRNSQQIFETIRQMLPERSTGTPGSALEPLMPVLEIDGTDYVALLEIPSMGVQLPVADFWDAGKLTHSPARFFGSTYDHTLVIGGTDDPRQFGFCGQIDLGVTLTVTDMTGAVFTYTVTDVNRSSSAETQWLTETTHDLTLFCRDQYSMEYLAVRCDFTFR